MPNALVEHYRRALPSEHAQRSEAELTAAIADMYERDGTLDAIRQQYPDFNRDLLNLRNAGGDVWREGKAALAAGVYDRLPGTIQSFGALAADAVGQDALAQDIGLAPLANRAGDYLRGLARENKQEAAARMREAGGRTIARIEDIRPTSPRDYVLWALPTFAENAPSMGVSLGAGVAASVASGGAAVPGLLAAGGASIVQNVGDQYGDLAEEPGVPRDKAITAALVGGTVSGVLDVIPQVAPLAKLFPGLGKSAIGKLVGKVAGKGGWKGAGTGALTQAFSEGGTEALQELVAIASEEYATGKTVAPETVRSRVLNAAAGGAVVGGPVGAITGAIPERSATDDPVEPTQGGGDIEKEKERRRQEVLTPEAPPVGQDQPAGSPDNAEIPAQIPTSEDDRDNAQIPAEAAPAWSLPELSPEQVEGLKGRTVELMASEDGAAQPVEMDAHAAWTDTMGRVDTYRKLLRCLGAA